MRAARKERTDRRRKTGRCTCCGKPLNCKELPENISAGYAQCINCRQQLHGPRRGNNYYELNHRKNSD
jgi:hypothetical protein